jgi:hypothetical protein
MALKTWMLRFAVAFVVIWFSACGGGGETGESADQAVTNPPAVEIVDPAPAYSGAKTQATVSEENAAFLALEGYGAGNIGTTMGEPFTVGKSTAAAEPSFPPAPRLAQIVKKSVRRIEFPRRTTRPIDTSEKASVTTVTQQPADGSTRVYTDQVAGDGGGYASYTIFINDFTGSLSGTLSYDEYTSQGIVLTGDVAVFGTFDASQENFSRLTISFNSLSMSQAEYKITLVGSLSWGFNYSSSSETLTIDMAMIDHTYEKTYWFNDYTLTTTYSPGGMVQTISGRFYEPNYGYVDLSTETALVVYEGSSWPESGTLLFSGDQGTWARLDFQSDHLLIQAETDGAGDVNWQTEFPTVEEPLYNSPPVADAGLDQNVSQWDTVSLDGGGSYDPDEDPLSFSWHFESCPAACPDLTGYSTATPSFTARDAGTYVLALTVNDGQTLSSPDTVSVTAAAVTASDPDLLQKTWEYGIYGTSIGAAGLFLLNRGLGTPEIVGSASVGDFWPNTFWYNVRRSADGKYEQTWRSEIYPDTIVRIVGADVNSDGTADVIVGLANGRIYIYDGLTLEESYRFSAAATLTALAAGDLDGDGKPEIVTSDGIGIFVYSAETGEMSWSISAGGGNSLAIGNLDADPALEIVATANGGRGYVVDASSRTVEWEYVTGFGAQVALGDLDGDGMQEIVGAAAWYKITVFDADRRTPVWEIPTDLDIGALLVADTDGDGVPEILYGDGQWGEIHAVGAETRTERWSVSNPEHGVSGLALGDADGDGEDEVLWGAGGTSTGEDHLFIADPSIGAIEWQNVHLDGPLSPVAVGDVDDDGEDEIVMVSFKSNSGYDEGVVHIFDARSHALEYREPLGIMDWMGVRSVAIGDVDGDGVTEYVVTTGNLYTGVIRVYDGTTHALKKESAGYDGNYFSALAVGDVDGDGSVEIVAGQGREHTGATGTYLIVFNGATLEEKWRSVDLGSIWGSVYDIELADLNGDGRMDIAASLSGDRLIVYDAENHDLLLLAERAAHALEVADLDGDGAPELLVGRDDGQIDVLDGVTFEVKETVSTYGSAPIDALRVSDLDSDGSGEWLATRGGGLVVLGGEDHGIRWKSHDLSENLGLYNHLAIRDTDGDGRKEVFLGDDLALYQFE